MKKLLILLAAVSLLSPVLANACAQDLPGANRTAPDFTLTALDGSTVTLSALYGRPVLLNFWASWCGPCRSEMPYLQEISADPAWRGRDLLVLAVNIQEPAETVSKFMTENNFNFTVLLDTKGEAARLYNISSIPATYIIGKDGIIKDNRVGAFMNKSQVERMLLSALGEDQ